MKIVLFLTKTQQIFLYSIVFHLCTVLLVRLSSRWIVLIVSSMFFLDQGRVSIKSKYSVKWSDKIHQIVLGNVHISLMPTKGCKQGQQAHENSRDSDPTCQWHNLVFNRCFIQQMQPVRISLKNCICHVQYIPMWQIITPGWTIFYP